MANRESEEFATYIRRLLEATSAGDIPWKRVNPTTIVWDSKSTADPTASFIRASLQLVSRFDVESILTRTSKTGKKESYVFTLTQLPNRESLLSIDDSTDPELQKVLGELYGVATSGLTRRGLDALASILPKDHE